MIPIQKEIRPYSPQLNSTSPRNGDSEKSDRRSHALGEIIDEYHSLQCVNVHIIGGVIFPPPWQIHKWNRKGVVSFGAWFYRFQSMVSWPHCFSAHDKVKISRTAWGKMVTFWQPEYKKSSKKEPGSRDILFKGMLPATCFLVPPPGCSFNFWKYQWIKWLTRPEWVPWFENNLTKNLKSTPLSLVMLSVKISQHSSIG